MDLRATTEGPTDRTVARSSTRRSPTPASTPVSTPPSAPGRALLLAVLGESLGLGLFMISAGAFGTALEHPSSLVHRLIPDAFTRRALMGVIMGLTAMALIRSPWGKRSGAHLNPAVTWTFYRLGRIDRRVALGYTLGQFVGGALGVALLALLLGRAFVDVPVDAVATLPGAAGRAVAFVAEAGISGLLMLVVLTLGRSPRAGRHTPSVVALLLFLYITFEAPLSGMSMNPARTLASAWPAGHWDTLWIYFTAPLLGMLLAAEIHVRLHHRARGAGDGDGSSPPAQQDGCAKLLHVFPCLFCGEGALAPPRLP